jgi:hypothetical protein
LRGVEVVVRNPCQCIDPAVRQVIHGHAL